MRARAAVGEALSDWDESVSGGVLDAGECVECGACEKRCPFGVAIRENMKKAAAVFGY